MDWIHFLFFCWGVQVVIQRLPSRVPVRFDPASDSLTDSKAIGQTALSSLWCPGREFEHTRPCGLRLSPMRYSLSPPGSDVPRFYAAAFPADFAQSTPHTRLVI